MDKKITGYRLHFKRILFSGGEIVRTIKFPLSSTSLSSGKNDLINNFESQLINDDLKIRGDVNLNDYLIYEFSSKPIYTLFNFWIDSLKSGIVWADKPASLIDFINEFYLIKSPYDLVWERATEEFKKYFDKKSFKEILISGPIRKTKNPSKKESFKKRIISCLKDEYVIKEGNSLSVESPEVLKFINKIVNSFFDEDGNLILEGKKQDNFWLNEFGIDKSIIQKTKPEGELKDITFVIIPELIVDSFNKEYEVDSLIEKRRVWLKKRFNKEKEIEKNLQLILGLSNNFNGFSNFLGKGLRAFQGGKILMVFGAMSKINPSVKNQENKEKVLESLNFLSDKSKFFTPRPALNIVKSWADYRTFFGGKLQSWYSNGIRRKNELKVQVKEIYEFLTKTADYLAAKISFNDENERYAIKEFELINLKINRLKQFIENENFDISSEDGYLIFDTLLSSLRTQLNLYYQKYLSSEEDNIRDNKDLKGIYQKIYKPIAFFGKATKRKNKKVIEETVPIIESGINNLFSLMKKLEKTFLPKNTFSKVKNKNEDEETILRNLVDYYQNKVSHKMLNSLTFVNKLEEVMKSVVEENDWDRLHSNKYVFYKSEYQKGALELIPLKKGSWIDIFEKIILEMTSYLLTFDLTGLLKDKKILLDWIEIAKNTLAKLIRFNTCDVFTLDELNLDLRNFPKAMDYIKIFKITKVDKNELNFIVQSFILSELKGAATLFSKEKYLAKYNVQAIDADKKFKLFYKPNDGFIEREVNRKNLLKPHQYFVALDKIEDKKIKEKANFLLLTKEDIKPVFIKEENFSKLYKISSSFYQIQFLDKFIYMPEEFKDLGIRLSEWNFVLEREYKIDWDLYTKRPKMTFIENSKKNKLYLSIPFNVFYKSKKKDVSLSKVISNRLSYPILGIDVGEYGLAYLLAEFSDKKIKILKKGFIEDRNIANIKDKFAEIQLKARTGIFNEEDTTIARVRENAIGSLRNKVHYILTSDRGASIIYEGSISNFETGSGRTTKIYDSVKRADTEFETEADKFIHNHVWGKNTKYIGRSLSAYGSSYICSKCYRSIYQFKKEDLREIKLLMREGNILTFFTPIGKVWGYSKNEKFKKDYQFKPTEKDFKEFIKILKDFARPPVGKNKTEVLEKFFLKDNDKKAKIDEFKKKRGASAIFICPFCGFIADADIQAAFIMAVRGYIRFKESQIKEENKSLILEKTINYLKEVQFKPEDIFLPF